MGNHRIRGASSDTRHPVCRVAGVVLGAAASLAIGTVASVHAADEVYKYDALGRLIRVELPDSTNIDYVLDAAGNRVQKKVSQDPPNNPPVAVNDSAYATGIWQPVTVNAVANDTDPDGDTLEITSVGSPWNGTTTLLNPTQIRVTGTSPGTATFSYTVSDGNGGTDIGSVTFTVAGGGGGDL